MSLRKVRRSKGKKAQRLQGLLLYSVVNGLSLESKSFLYVHRTSVFSAVKKKKKILKRY